MTEYILNQFPNGAVEIVFPTIGAKLIRYNSDDVVYYWNDIPVVIATPFGYYWEDEDRKTAKFVLDCFDKFSKEDVET